MIKILGIASGVLMPFFNIPLIARIIRRRSSGDISLVWAAGVWICVMGMVPSSVQSTDPVLRIFGVMNGIFFTGVIVTVLLFHPSTRKNRAAL